MEFKVNKNKKSAEVKLQGPAAVVAVLVFGLFSLMGYASRSSSFEGQGKEVIISHLKAEYMRKALPQLSKVEDNSEAEDEEDSDQINEYLELNRVSLRSAEFRGSDDHFVARVDVRVNGKTPPDGREVRYFKMKHSHLLGWSVEAESSALSYWLSFSLL